MQRFRGVYLRASSICWWFFHCYSLNFFDGKSQRLLDFPNEEEEVCGSSESDINRIIQSRRVDELKTSILIFS